MALTFAPLISLMSTMTVVVMATSHPPPEPAIDMCQRRYLPLGGNCTGVSPTFCTPGSVCDDSAPPKACRLPVGQKGCGTEDDHCVGSSVCLDNACKIPVGHSCSQTPDWCERGTTCGSGLNKCQTNVCLNDSAAVNCWTASPLPSGLAATHVSVGPAGVWATRPAQVYGIYYREGSYQHPLSLGTGWSEIDGELVQLDVGKDIVWGVNGWQIWFTRSGISPSSPEGIAWHDLSAGNTWVSVSPEGSVWARNLSGRAVYYDGDSSASSNSWQDTGLDIQSVDAGLAGVWALDTTGRLVCRLGTHDDVLGVPGNAWQVVDSGPFRSVSSGKDVVVVVDVEGNMRIRSGVKPSTPTGQGWLSYPGGDMKQVDVYQTSEGAALWGVNTDGHVFHSVIATEECCVTI